MALGLVNEAVPLGEKVLGLTRKVFGPEHPDTLVSMDNLALGLGVARRAWLEAGQVLNARPLGDLLAWARPAR